MKRAKLQRFNEDYTEEQIEKYDEICECPNEIICPHCGTTFDIDIDELEGGDSFENKEKHCTNCGDVFYMDCEPEIEFRITTRRKNN